MDSLLYPGSSDAGSSSGAGSGTSSGTSSGSGSGPGSGSGWYRHSRTSLAAKAGVVLGIIAIVLNALLVTVPLGVLCGAASLLFSAYARKKYRLGLGGLMASGVSFFILAVWLLSLLVPMLVDPTF